MLLPARSLPLSVEKTKNTDSRFRRSSHEKDATDRRTYCGGVLAERLYDYLM
jgi:hypothetical protein